MKNLIISLCIGCMFFGSNKALACLSSPEPTGRAVKRLRKESTAIFVGIVKEVTKEKDGYTATFVVHEWWKGTRS